MQQLFFIIKYSFHPSFSGRPISFEEEAMIIRVKSIWKGGGRMLFHRNDRGQGMVEYALLIVLLAVVVVFMIEVMGGVVQGMYDSIVEAFEKLIS
jgi:Flp pilus assembly pilin Flp